MPINKAIMAAMKAASRLKPEATKAYRLQRTLEDVASWLAAPDPRCLVSDMSAVMADDHQVPLRLFIPREQVTRGLIVFFHGGGWVTGSAQLYHDCCARMAVETSRRVLSVDYRRAPEHRFPIPAEDCYEVARRIYAGELLGDVPGEDIVLFGDSAGGNLAAVVSLMARDRGDFTPRTQILLYPVVGNDYSDDSPFASVRENGKDYLLTAQDMAGYLDLYASSPDDLTNPYFTPLCADDLSGQPRTLMMSAEYCPLRDEDEAYAQRLAEAGNDVQCYRIHDAIHGYFLQPTMGGLIRDTYRLIRHFLDGEPLSGNDSPLGGELVSGGESLSDADSSHGTDDSGIKGGDEPWRTILIADHATGID